MLRNSVLIIHLGFPPDWSAVGRAWRYRDVFCSTCLLDDFRGWEVTWISSPAMGPLLQDNHLIDRLILVDRPNQIDPASLPAYHTVIQLEADYCWHQFARRIETRHRFEAQVEETPDRETETPNLYSPVSLFGLLGREWTGQQYRLGYQSPSEPQYDIGLNSPVIPDCPTHAWPEENWRDLKRGLDGDFNVVRPKSCNGLADYLAWIASVRLLISTNSLGLYLALAMNKEVLALLNEDEEKEVFLYGRGLKLVAMESLPTSLEGISIDSVHQTVLGMLSRENVAPVPLTAEMPGIF